MMSGLLWLLVVFDGQESESESLVRLTETTTSLPPIGGFSWADSSSSIGTHRETDRYSTCCRYTTDRHTDTDRLMHLVPGCERCPVPPAGGGSPPRTAGQRHHWNIKHIMKLKTSLSCRGNVVYRSNVKV